MAEAFEQLRRLSPDERSARIAQMSDLESHDVALLSVLLAHDEPTELFLGRPVERATAHFANALLADSPPAVFGKYRLVRPIGRGSFGTVFLAEQLAPARSVAIKLLSIGANDEDRRRFDFEAQALARLCHPHVAGILEFGECLGRAYLAMEYVKGDHLDTFVASRGLDTFARVRLLRQICDGVTHIHQRGVLHRDLAPKNILVSSDGLPKIVDFGLACDHSGVPRDIQRMTLQGATIGTVRYSSPEQIRGRLEQIDERSDVYALGVVAFELLFGLHPYLRGHESLAEAFEQLDTGQLAKPQNFRGLSLGEAFAVMRMAVERDRSLRYQSVKAFSDDLLRLTENRPVQAVAPSLRYRTAKWLKRNRLTVAVGAAVSVLVTSAVISTAGSLVRERHTRNAAINATQVVVDRLVAPMGPSIGTLAERESLLVAIESDVLEMYETSPEDPRVLRIYAEYQLAQSDIQRDRAQHKSALRAAERATAAHAALHSVEPLNSQIAQMYSIALAKLGDAQMRAGLRQAGLESYRRALSLDHDRVVATPDDLSALNTLFWSLTRLAELSGECTSFDIGLSAQAWDVAERMRVLSPHDWRSLETLVHTRFGQHIRTKDQSKDVSCLLEAERAARELVAKLPTSTVHNSKYLLILLSMLRTADDATPTFDREACLQRALRVEQVLSANTGTLRTEDRTLIDFRAYLARVASHCARHSEVTAHCERLIDYVRRYVESGIGTRADVEWLGDTLEQTYKPALQITVPGQAEAAYDSTRRTLIELETIAGERGIRN